MKCKRDINSFLSVLEFKGLTGIMLDDQNIEVALVETTQMIKDAVFIKKQYKTRNSDKQFRLAIPIADYDCDGVVTNNDIRVFEHNRNDFINPDIERNANILSFIPTYGMLEMDDYYPINKNNELYIEYYIARYPNEQMIPHLKKLNSLMASDKLFSALPLERLQEGISSWSLNGVSVSFDNNTISSIRQSLSKEIQYRLKYITPIVSGTTSIGFDRDDIYNSRRFGRANINNLTDNIRFR